MKPRVDIVAMNPRFGQVCRRARSQFPKPARDKIHVAITSDWDTTGRPECGRDRPASPVLVVGGVADVPLRQMARGGRAPRFLLFTEGLPPEAISARLPGLNVRDAHRLHVAQDQDPDTQQHMVQRLLTGYVTSGFKPIVDAWWEWTQPAQFVALSHTFDRLVIPHNLLRPWLGDDREALANFEIDSDGSYVYWPHADAHFGWDQLRYLIDPAAVETAKSRTADYNRRYGEAIRRVREEAGLNQTDIPGLTARHLRRIERGEVAATRKALDALAAAHQLPMNKYLDALALAMKMS